MSSTSSTGTIQILSRKKFAFKNPDKYMLKPAVDPKPGVTDRVDMTTAYGDVYFETTPNKVQVAPKWIMDDNMFIWGLADGDIMVIDVKAGESRKQVDARADAQQQISDTDRLQAQQDAAVKTDELRSELGAMNKTDLIEHAKATHDLDLSPSLKKDDMIQAVVDAHLAKAEPGQTEQK